MKNHKDIFTKILILLLSILLFVPVFIYFSLQIPPIQKKVSNVLTNKLTKALNTTVSINRVSYSITNNLVIKGIYIEDYRLDTLFYLNKVELGIWEVFKRKLHFNKLIINGLKLHIFEDTTGQTNLLIFLQNLPPSKPKKKKHKAHISIKIDKIIVKNCQISYTKQLDSIDTQKFNPKYFNIKPLNFQIQNLNISDSSYAFSLNNFFFRDIDSKFQLNNLKFRFFLTNHQLKIENFNLNLPKSRINLPLVQLQFDSLKQLSKPQTLYFIFDIDTSTSISTKDLAYFVPKLANYNLNVKFGAEIDGNLSNINFRPVYIKFGNYSRIFFTGKIIGLPNKDNVYLNFYFDTLRIALTDIPMLRSYLSPKVNKNLKKVAYINAQASISGLLTDFTYYIQMHSALGKLSSSAQVYIDSSRHIIGFVNLNQFKLNLLTNNPKLGQITLSDSFRISLSPKFLTGETLLKIDSVFLNGYNYSNISLMMRFTKHKFGGFLDITDPNLVLHAQGDMQLGKFKAIDASVNLVKANLYKLKLDKEDPNAFLKTAFDLNFHGKSINTINGYLTFSQPLVYIKNLEKLQINHFKFFTKAQNLHSSLPMRILYIKSDLFDFSLNGQYNLTDLGKYIQTALQPYLPKIFIKSQKTSPFQLLPGKEQPFFNSQILLKNLTEVTRIFAPTINLALNSKVSFSYSKANNKLKLSFASDSINIGNSVIKKINLQAFNTHKNLVINLKNNSLHSSFLTLQHLNTKFILDPDTSTLAIVWKNNSSKLNKGKIYGTISFIPTDSSEIFSTLHADTIWVDSNLWSVRKFLIWKQNKQIGIISDIYNPDYKQQIDLNGYISPDSSKRLVFKILNFELSQLNPLLKKLSLTGNLNTIIQIQNIYKAPLINDQLVIKNLHVNNVNLQDLIALLKLNSKKHIATFNLVTQKSLQSPWPKLDSSIQKFINVNGLYNLKNKSYDISVKLHKFKIKTFYPYFKKIISSISRFTTLEGEIHITGQNKNFKLNGLLSLIHAAFKIKPINVAYSINNRLKIRLTPQKIYIDTATIISQGGTGHAKLWGTFHRTSFGENNFSIHLAPDSLMVLNLPPETNKKYYGKAFISGNILLNGLGPSLALNADVTTEPNTDFYFVINTPKTMVIKADYITFIKPKKEKTVIIPKEITSKKAHKSSFSMNINLQINPLSNFHIIIDPQTGQALNLQGSGLLNIKKNPYSSLTLFGSINIQNGTYLFSLQNIINKKFIIQPGSKITWNGSPLDAILDIVATYTVNSVNLYDLTFDDNLWNVRTPAVCKIIIKGKLTQPQISFDLELPKAPQRVVTQVKNLDPADKAKQVLSLLILGKFQPLPGLEFNPNQLATNMNAADILSSQISNILSSFNQNLQLGFNYQQNQKGKTQLELALSYKFWKERVSIHTDVGIGNKQTLQQSNSNQFIGDFDLEVKLNKKGNLKLKVFNKTNRNEFIDKGPYTQGVGIFYQHSFNSLIPKSKKNEQKKSKSKSKLKSKPTKSKTRKDTIVIR